MKYLLYENFVINSDKEVTEIISLLSQNVDKKIRFRINQYSSDIFIKPYEGKLDNKSFTISRIIKGRNPFLPIIKGKLIKSESGSKILVIMRIKILPLIFVILWSLGPTMFFFLVKNKLKLDTVFISVLWVFIGYLFAYLPFDKERKMSKKFLINLLK